MYIQYIFGEAFDCNSVMSIMNSVMSPENHSTAIEKSLCL